MSGCEITTSSLHSRLRHPEQAPSQALSSAILNAEPKPAFPDAPRCGPCCILPVAKQWGGGPLAQRVVEGGNPSVSPAGCHLPIAARQGGYMATFYPFLPLGSSFARPDNHKRSNPKMSPRTKHGRSDLNPA
ncbi:hypothetical protein GCM10017612_10210 [Novosphingobium resinovorum]|nr:hypothetical protein GCM10017612_10210 [Novosphingobium resinovorum]